jgi:hypothetical protein
MMPCGSILLDEFGNSYRMERLYYLEGCDLQIRIVIRDIQNIKHPRVVILVMNGINADIY